MKILYVTTISSTMDFFPAHIKMLQAHGHTVELAANTEQGVSSEVSALGCKIHHIPFSRSPLSRDNIRAYRKVKQLISAGQYDTVHTHTPNASILVRLACRKLRKKGLTVIYTAHGFHFYQGAPLKNWLLFYPAEKICSYMTDVLITINHEDYDLAKQKLHAGKTVYVPGVGLDPEKFRLPHLDRCAKRAELGLRPDDFVLLSVGELNQNKNHASVLRALAALHDPKIQYLIAGVGDEKGPLIALARELGISAQVHLLGYRKDVPALYNIADVFVHPSFREGLPVSIMEAMASGLPVLCSKIRGNVDLVHDSPFLFMPDDLQQLVHTLFAIAGSPSVALRKIGLENQKRVEEFSTKSVLRCLENIYINFV